MHITVDRESIGRRSTKAVFLDRDGTINVEKHYLYKAEDFEFIPGVIAGLKKLQDAGYLLIIITNQSGIARGYYTEDAFAQLNTWMLDQLEKNNVHIEKVYYCPHLPDAQIKKYRKMCNCRKPRLGLYEKACEEFAVNMSLSWAIGDRIRDCAVCEKTECRGFLVGKNEDMDIIEGIKRGNFSNIRYATDLYACAEKILSSEL